MRIGTLLVAALIVSPISSCGASLATSGILSAQAAVDGGGLAAMVTAGLVIAFMATLVSVLFVLAALVVLALPLTVALDKIGASPLPRDLALLAIVAGASALLYPVSLDWYQGEGWIFPIYAAVAGLVWIAALRWIDRRKQAVDQAASAPTGTEPA